MDLFTKKDPTRDEYIIAHSLVMLGMKKIGQEKVDKIVKNDDIKYVNLQLLLSQRSNKIGVTGIGKMLWPLEGARYMLDGLKTLSNNLPYC